jgi:hypothetical protein
MRLDSSEHKEKLFLLLEKFVIVVSITVVVNFTLAHAEVDSTISKELVGRFESKIGMEMIPFLGSNYTSRLGLY